MLQAEVQKLKITAENINSVLTKKNAVIKKRKKKREQLEKIITARSVRREKESNIEKKEYKPSDNMSDILNMMDQESKSIVNKSKNWKLLLGKVKLHAHKKHNFINKLMKNKKINYIRINIYPDGGISRIRVLGKAE